MAVAASEVVVGVASEVVVALEVAVAVAVPVSFVVVSLDSLPHAATAAARHTVAHSTKIFFIAVP